MRPLVVICAVAGLFVPFGGCGGSEAPPLAQPRGLDNGGERWSAIASTLSPRMDSSSENLCSRGDVECLDAVVAEMTRRYRSLAEVCDHRAPFALMYLRVTEGVTTSRYRDPAYLRHLDALFAQQYFDAFDRWRSGRQERVPEAWRIAFAAARDRQVSALGDMMLGMNAHISRDLPFALAAAGLRQRDGTSAKADFDAVNDLLAEVQGPMIEEQSRLFDPTVGSFTSPLVGVYRSNITGAIAGWRTEAWYNARRLLAARSAADRRAVSDTIEQSAAARGRLVQIATSYPVVGGDTESRDSYCKRVRRER